MRKSNETEKNANRDSGIIDSSGNVFVDLDFPMEEAENLLARTIFMVEIKKAIRENGWSQASAAKHLNVSQPRISDLMHGRIEKFSVDMLMKWLDRLGRRVTFRIDKKDEVA
jgi:predicted XRE-type DNA-binding protein